MENKDKEIYNGWIVSNSLMKRSFAIYGHIILAYIIMVLIMFILLIVFGGLYNILIK